MYKSYQQILGELLADIAASTSLTNLLPGSVLYTILAVVARALRGVWFMIEQLVKLFFVSSSYGTFLERRCAERGVIRKIGTAAGGIATLTRSTPAPIGTTIRKGTTLATMDGEVEYTVDEDVLLPPGWTAVGVPVTCTSIGIVGNLPQGTYLQVVGVQVIGVEGVVVPAGGLTGGVDTESDEQLRARYLFTIQNPQNGGTAADYIVWAMETEGVVQAICLPLNRGPGTVDVVISDGSIPADDLVSKVSEHIEEKRPVGANVQILKPEGVAVDVTATLTVATGYDAEELATDVRQAIQTYIGKVPIGGVVRLTGLIQAVGAVPGVVDFQMTAPTANIDLDPIQIATTGILNVV